MMEGAFANWMMGPVRRSIKITPLMNAIRFLPTPPLVLGMIWGPVLILETNLS